MSPSVSDDSGVRRAAVLVAQLDPATADLLLGQLSDTQAARVRKAVMELDTVDSHEERKVAAAFKQAQLGSPTDDTASSEPPEDDALTQRPFEFLERTTPGALSRLLFREHPQTVAVVLAHLPVEMAADVIREWPDALQAEVLTRVARLDEMHPEALASLEQAVYSLLAGAAPPRQRGAAGVVAVESIVAQLGRRASASLLAQLARRDRELAQVIRVEHPVPANDVAGATVSEPASPGGSSPSVKSVGEPSRRGTCIDFEDLERLAEQDWARLIRAVDSQIMLLALAGAPPSLVESLEKLAAIPLARSLQKRLAALGPVGLEDMDQAQSAVSRVAAELIDAGEISPVTPQHFAAAI